MKKFHSQNKDAVVSDDLESLVKVAAEIRNQLRLKIDMARLYMEFQKQAK